jgi:DNA (cytosine-5)-methyltransferase 1
MLRAIREISPRWVVGENVRGLTNWNGGLVFDEVQSDLEAEGYEVLPFLLPACAVNAPHRRDRIWFIGYNTTNSYSNTKSEIKGNYAEVRGFQNEECRTENSSPLFRGNNQKTVTNTSNKGLQRSKIIGGIKGIRQNGNEQFAGRFPSAWDKFPTQPPLCSRNDELSERLAGITLSKHRTESIKAYGNAVVPQVVLQIFRAIEQFEINNHVD